MPWFEYYSDAPGLAGSERLATLVSVLLMGKIKGEEPIPENGPADPKLVVQLRAGLRRDQVREGEF